MPTAPTIEVTATDADKMDVEVPSEGSESEQPEGTAKKGKKHLWRPPPKKGSSTDSGKDSEAEAATDAPNKEEPAKDTVGDIDDETAEALKEYYPPELQETLEQHIGDKQASSRRVPIGLRNNIASFKTMSALPKVAENDSQQLEEALKAHYPAQLHQSMKGLLDNVDSTKSNRRVPIGLRNNVASFKTMGLLPQVNVPSPAEGLSDDVVAEVMKSAYPQELHSNIDQHLKSDQSSSRRVPIGLRNNVASFKTMGTLPRVTTPAAAVPADEVVVDVMKSAYPAQLHANIEQHLKSCDGAKSSRRVPIGLRNNVASFKTMGVLPKAGAPAAAPALAASGDAVADAMKSAYPEALHGEIQQHLQAEGTNRRVPIGLRNNVTSFKTMSRIPQVQVQQPAAAAPVSDAEIAGVLKNVYPEHMHDQINAHLSADAGEHASRRVPIGLRNQVTSFKTMGVLPHVNHKRPLEQEQDQQQEKPQRKKPVMLSEMAAGGDDLKKTMKTFYPEHLHAKLEQHLNENSGHVPLGLRNNVQTFKTMTQLRVSPAPDAAPAAAPAPLEKDLRTYYPPHLHAQLEQHLTSTNLAGLMSSTKPRDDGAPPQQPQIHIPIGLRNKMLATPVEQWDTMFANVSEEVKRSLKLCLIAH